MSIRTTLLGAATIACLGACSSSTISSAPAALHDLTVQAYTAKTDATGVGVSSYLVAGPSEAILVDAQLYRADADAVVAMVRASGKRLTTVFLTHAHPDHFMGLDVVRRAFPDAAIVSTPAVVADYAATAPATFQALKGALGDAVADALVTPRAVDGRALAIDGRSIEILEAARAGESAHAAALVLDREAAIVAGDILYNDVHLYLAECTSDGWKSDLDAIAARHPKTVYPGHGGPGGPEVIDGVRQYIDDVVPILASTPETGGAEARAAAAEASIHAKYPSFRSDYLLDVSVSRYYQGCAK